MSFHNPFAKFDVTQGWRDGSHRNNPAIDFETPVGFEFTSPEDGTYYHYPSNLSRRDQTAAGHQGYLLLANGDRIEFGHLQRHIARHGAKVRKGVTVLAATGNTGYVRPLPTHVTPHAGAHVHTVGRRSGTRERFDWTLDVDKPVTGQPASAGRGSMYVVTSGTYLRSAKTTKRAVIKYLPVGQRLRVLSVSGLWAKVLRADGRTIAYVYAPRLTKLTLTAKTETRLRSLPKTKSTLLLSIRKGAKVTVLGPAKPGRRVRAKVAGKVGWIYLGHFS